MGTMSPKATTLTDNKDVYSTVEFARWVDRADLDADERFLIAGYLSPTARTLEAGTGGGRILLALRQMGFTDLHGFDFVPGLIEKARAADPEHAIHFDVQNAARLDYPDASFDQIVYLQQLLSCIDDDATRWAAVGEAFRILRPGGVALFSALCFEVRRKHPIYRMLMTHWRMLRRVRGSSLSIQAMPWMRLGDRFNPGALLDRGPYVYWFRADEMVSRLRTAGFTIQAVGSSRQIEAGKLCDPPAPLPEKQLRGALYCVCKKSSAPR